MLRLFCIGFIALLACSCTPELPKDVAEAKAQLPEKIDYNIHVKPILSDKCFSCHGPDQARQKAGLRLDLASAAYGELPENPGKTAIQPGSLNGSEVFHRILSNDPEYKMPEPKSHLSLSAKEKATIIQWIEQGAAYKPHWAFVAPQKPTIPALPANANATNEIDHFVLSRLEQEKLKPSAEAKREVLLRRLSLDLTGLPPTPEEVDTYITDRSPDAYEKQVDRLLQSPHYGERLAVDWLDLARYADSHGYTVDHLRDVSPYRDWVIQAFNQNMPYDQFIQWQLAGDLMPKPTRDMLIATAFNRLHQQNAEGGIIEEEFQTEYVIDRTNTLGVAFMGLQVGCARCHDHKFDPVSQKNYYELYSFFNNVKEAGQISWDDAMPTPTLMLPDIEKKKILNMLAENVVGHEKKMTNIFPQINSAAEQWITSKGYASLAKEVQPSRGLQAQYDFNQGKLINLIEPKKSGGMRRELSNAPGDPPQFENVREGMALKIEGDEWLDIGPVGIFRKSDPFTISIRVWMPKEFKEGVIFHKCVAERLYNYRGYYLYVRNNKLEVALSHTAPSNAITRVSASDAPHEQWIQLTMTYDGTSKAGGLQLYLNGAPVELETTMDQLTKDILLDGNNQVGLQIGAWNRGLGLKNGKVDDILVYNRQLTDFEIKVLAGKSKWLEIVSKSPEQLSSADRRTLTNYYQSVLNPEMLAAQRELKRLRDVLADSTERVPELMVMQEMPVRKKAFILNRGTYSAPGVEVFPNTPEAIAPFPSSLPKNRLGLAQWLTSDQHPLTARVAVNRYWQNFFGTGLVKTSEDLGNQGEQPSHPELLDWLAVSFRESGWDVKKLCKYIVMSTTYRQDSRSSANAKARDPENRFLSHGPSTRLSAEMLRDNALAASGLLNSKIGGKSVRPYQPDGLWEINNTSYVADKGEEVYRRSLYVIVKRSVPNPTLATFDAAGRSNCTVRRQPTNTPLQALVTLNDPTFVEAAKVLGESMSRESDPMKAITRAYRKITGLVPNEKELKLLLEMREVELKKFASVKGKAKGWLEAGQYSVDKKLPQELVAANAVVASVVLNSDACLTKR